MYTIIKNNNKKNRELSDMDEIQATKETVKTVFNIDIDFLIILGVTILGAIAAYLTKIYNRTRDFKFIDFIAVVIVGIFIAFVSFFISEYFEFSKLSTALISSISSTISMSIITKINKHEGEILKLFIKFIIKFFK